MTFATGVPSGTVTGTLYSCNSCDSGAATPNPPKVQVLSGGTAGSYTVDPASGRVTLTNVNVDATPPAVYLATATDGISAFIIGSDVSAIFGYAETQPPAVYGNASVSGTYTIGVDQMIDNRVLDLSGVAIAAVPPSGSITSLTVDASGQTGLVLNVAAGSSAFTINSTGSGTWNIFGSATTYAVTNGTKLFALDDTDTLAEIFVFEK
jgi:hypothetical protein